MTDSEDEIKRKFKKAYCPEKQVEENPVLEYCKFIIFEKFKVVEVKRPEKFGGDVSFKSYNELENWFVSGKLHPADMKNMVAGYINELLVPVRKHFEKNVKAKKLKKLVDGYQVTR